jgi:protein-L-isoaspartate(D-aspartate) O-methyltransferase
MGMASDELRWREERGEMVETQLRRRGIRDARVLQAFLDVPRDRFVLPERLAEAYQDHPLDIGCGQTISQPYMVALMTEVLHLRGDERTLEIGTGSGYQTAILAKLCRAVYTIERLPALNRGAQEVLGRLGFANVRFRVGDGTLGWPEEAPFDRIIVTAGGPSVPPSLEAQLADAGRLVMPVGSWGGQDLVALERHGQRLERESHGGCVFVRLVGKEGWPER